MRRMNAAQCKTVTKPGFYRADDTLYLYVKPTGRKSWVQRVVVGGRRRNLGVVGTAGDGVAVVGHAAAPGGGNGLEGVGTLGIEAGERARRFAHAGYAAELVVHGVGNLARVDGTLPRIL